MEATQPDSARLLDGKARPRTTTVLVCALVGACIGFVVGFAVSTALSGWPHQLNLDDLGDGVLRVAGGFLGGAVGWLIGAVGGWLISRPAGEPTKKQARSWRVSSAFLALLVFVALSLTNDDLSTSVGGPEGVIWRTMYVTFAACLGLVAVTLLVLAQRRGFQTGAVIGALVAVMILAAAGMRFGELLPLDGAWLNAWRTEQVDTASFAPNALVPAATACPGVVAVGGGWSSDWLDGHVPRWLPGGFGLLTWSTKPSLGVWADAECRLIRVVLEGHPDGGHPNRERPTVIDRVGDWNIMLRPCPPDLGVTESLCRQYEAWSSEGGGVRLQMWGIDRDEGDRIAMGIPNGTEPGTLSVTTMERLGATLIPFAVAIVVLLGFGGALFAGPWVRAVALALLGGLLGAGIAQFVGTPDDPEDWLGMVNSGFVLGAMAGAVLGVGLAKVTRDDAGREVGLTGAFFLVSAMVVSGVLAATKFAALLFWQVFVLLLRLVH